MPDRNHPKSSKHRVGQVLPLILVGSGLIILSTVGLLLWPGSDVGDNIQVQAEAQYSSIPVKVDFEAPELTVMDLNGAPVSLADYRGQVILVNNWATWCPPCKAEMPDLQTFYKNHHHQGFMIVAIDAGDPIYQIRQFVNEHELTFDILADPNMDALVAFRNDSLPSSYVIDETGVVQLAWTGAITLEMLEKHLTPLLEE